MTHLVPLILLIRPARRGRIARRDVAQNRAHIASRLRFKNSGETSLCLAVALFRSVDNGRHFGDHQIVPHTGVLID